MKIRINTAFNINEVDKLNILKEIREQNKLNQTQTANILGISVQRYNSYERKRRKIPVEIAILISKNFKISLEDIFLGMD